jgi:hypothetical protein
LAAVGVTLAATLYASAGPVTPASAQTAPGVVTYPLQGNDDGGTWIPGGDPAVSLITKDIALRAGESRQVVGQVRAIMDPALNLSSIDDTVAVQCLNSSGAQSGVSAWAETSLVPGRADTLRPSLLFTAPSAGVYRCHLLAVIQSAPSSIRMKALNGLTYLMLSTGDEVGSHWWQNPDCDSPGTLPTCTYLGGPMGPQWSYLFYNDSTPRYAWTAADNATLASATANVELTTCGHTLSCGGSKFDSDGSTVVSHLEAVQLDAAGRPCNLTRSGDRTDFIGKIPHHYNIPYLLSSVPVLSNCGSRRFIVRVYMKWVSGNPVKIDGTRPDPLAETNAFIVNATYAPTTATVPNVVGLSQAAAGNALAAAHLNLGTVTSVVDPAAAGTVIAQNAPAGAVEPLNSRVDLTVSLGLATVPNVLGWDESSAIDRIVGSGLTVGSVFSVDTCVDPGSVQTQGPSGGSTVVPGSAVDITVSTCTGGGEPK